MFLDRLSTALLALGLAAGCSATETPGTPNDDAGTGTVDRDGGVIDPGGDGGVTNPTTLARSTKANLRFKRNIKLRNDFAQALGLPADQVCTELGQYDCTESVHTVSLGGVEAYVLGLNEPLEETTTTAPIAIERVAMFACERRAGDDLANPGGAVIFKDLQVDGAGKLADVDAPAIASAIDVLHKRVLLRPPTAREIEHYRQLYRDIEADGEADPARDWAIVSCFSVLTTMESLFY